MDGNTCIYRFTKYEVYGDPDEIAAKISRALGRSAGEMGATVAGR